MTRVSRRIRELRIVGLELASHLGEVGTGELTALVGRRTVPGDRHFQRLDADVHGHADCMRPTLPRRLGQRNQVEGSNEAVTTNRSRY